MIKYYYHSIRTFDGWIEAKSKTEKGAKAECSRAYMDTPGAYYKLAVDHGDGQKIVIAVRSAYEKWRTI